MHLAESITSCHSPVTQPTITASVPQYNSAIVTNLHFHSAEMLKIEKRKGQKLLWKVFGKARNSPQKSTKGFGGVQWEK